MTQSTENPRSSKDIEAAEKQIKEQSRRIEFFITEFSVELLSMKLGNKDFIIPDYQREFTWELSRQSRFIESVLLGLPIPFLFFWESPNGKLEIVDGSQRLRTIHAFLNNELQLDALEVLPLLSEFRFSDLPISRQRKFKNRSIRGIILNEHADKDARFELFDRINTSPKAPSPMEIRRGALPGSFQKMVDELATHELMVKLAPVTEIRANKREREELVARFFAYGDGLEDYKDRPSTFLYNYTKKMNECFKKDPSLAQGYNARFLAVLQFVECNFPYGFRKSERANTTPRARFEAIAIGSYQAILKDSSLTQRTVDVSGWINGDEFQKVVGSDGANNTKRLKRRIDFVTNRILDGR